MPPKVKQQCANIKGRKYPSEQCKYPASKGEFCSRHSKHPRKYEKLLLLPPATRSIQTIVKKIQKWWKLFHGFKEARIRGFALFNRNLCHNDTEIASFEPVQTIPSIYFFQIKDGPRIWGFDIRYLVMQYETDGRLENPYTKDICGMGVVEEFRKRVNVLTGWKQSIHFEQTLSLTSKQSWNLRVLDMCLRLDMLGYRVATQWFSDLALLEQKRLYTVLFLIWQDYINETQKEIIVPGSSEPDTRLFKWPPSKFTLSSDIDSIRRTNINVMERLISSALQQSDRTLGAMYSVMSLCQVSHRCRSAYPWLLN